MHSGIPLASYYAKPEGLVNDWVEILKAVLTGEKNAVFIKAFGDIAEAREQLKEAE